MFESPIAIVELWSCQKCIDWFVIIFSFYISGLVLGPLQPEVKTLPAM